MRVDKPIAIQPQKDDEKAFCAPPGWTEVRRRSYRSRYFSGHVA
jgi:hypothetical protein